MNIKRLNEIKNNQSPNLTDVVEIAAENILTTSKHSKDIKAMLELILENQIEMSKRIEFLESRSSNIFQLELDEERPVEDEFLIYKNGEDDYEGDEDNTTLTTE